MTWWQTALVGLVILDALTWLVMARFGIKSFSRSARRVAVDDKPSAVFEHVLRSLNGLSRDVEAEPHRLVARAKTAMNWKTFGDVVEIEVMPKEPSGSFLEVRTWQRVPMTLVSWGRNTELQRYILLGLPVGDANA